MSDERRPTINIYASRHRGKTAEAERRKEQSERDRESANEKEKCATTMPRDKRDGEEISR